MISKNMMIKRRIKGLNRREFYKNLKKVLNDESAKFLKYTFEDYVEDYKQNCFASGCWGWYEVPSYLHKKHFAEEIRTN